MNDPQPSSVKSADRVLDLFELLARRGKGMSHAEIAEALGIPKSSLTQLVKNLLNRDYLAYAPDEKRYKLGSKFSLLARQTSQIQNIVSLAESLLAEVTRKTGESSALNLLEGREMKVVASISSAQRLVSHMRTGDLAPLYATSGGKAFLAFLPPAALDAYLGEVKLQPITPKTITSAIKLRKQLAHVRSEGVAEVFDEFTNGIVGIAVPIWVNDELLGAINVALPSVRYNPKLRATAVDALKDAAEVLRERLS